MPGLLLLLLGVAGHARAPDHPVLVLGDSISAAYGMSLEQGWVALLSRHLQALEPPQKVINASISGATTAEGLRRLPALLAQYDPSVVIIELGANDGLRGFPINTLRSNLNKMVELSKNSGARVILVAMEIPPNYGTRYTTAFRDSFRQVAAATASTLSPFLLDGVATRPTLMQGDGIHPGVEAQPLLLNNLLPTVLEVLAQG